MINTILATKIAMDARYDTRGRRVPVTILAAGPNIVVDLKPGKAVLAFGSRKKVKKPQSKFVQIAGAMPRYLREVKTAGNLKTADKITVSLFESGDQVKVTATSKGRGFAGVVKRWHFAGGPKTHGQSDRHRAPGSIGQTTTPGRVYKGKRMAGHFGNVRKTVRGLEVIEVDSAKNLLIVKGSVPGAKNGLVIVEKTGKVKTYTPPPNNGKTNKN